MNPSQILYSTSVPANYVCLSLCLHEFYAENLVENQSVTNDNLWRLCCRIEYLIWLTIHSLIMLIQSVSGLFQLNLTFLIVRWIPHVQYVTAVFAICFWLNQMRTG